MSGNFLHPRTVALLDNEALDDLAEIMLLMGEIGKAPLQLLTLVFLPKPDRGRRPIGLLTGIMRLWGKSGESMQKCGKQPMRGLSSGLGVGDQQLTVLTSSL